jgi:hypothetical protein
LLYSGPVEGGDGVGDGRAPVLAGNAELVEAQVGGQFGDVTGHCGGVVSGHGALGTAAAPVVDPDDGVVRGQQWHDVAPVRHSLRHAVQQEHRLAGAADGVMDLHAIDPGLAVCEPDSGVVSEVHLGEYLLLYGRVDADRGSSGAAPASSILP